jgi:hypothetical protein
MQYPEEWNQLPKHKRRKKIKNLRRQKNKRSNILKKVKNGLILTIVFILVLSGYKKMTKKTPDEIEFEQKIKVASLDGKVNEFQIEGREHITSEDSVEYQTNPPTSGDHFSLAENWGVYGEEIDDKAAVHGLEHGGVWISYKDIDDESINTLKKIGGDNAQSVIVSPRIKNDGNVVVASWGKMMTLEKVDEVLIQKYIETYKNQSPEQIAR